MDLSKNVVKAGAQQRPAEPGAASPYPAREFAGKPVSVPPGQAPAGGSLAGRSVGRTGAASAGRVGLGSRTVTAAHSTSGESAPATAPASGHRPEASRFLLHDVKPARASRVPWIPWLQPRQAAELEKMNSARLKAGRPGESVPLLNKTLLNKALGAAQWRLNDIEQYASRANRLLNKAPRETLGDEDVRQLYLLLRRHRSALAESQAELDARLARLRSRGALGPAEESRAGKLQQRLDDAHEFRRGAALSWLGPSLPLELTLPVDRARRVALESLVVPGVALSAHLPAPYPAEVHPPVLRALPYPHVPDLALTGLTGAGGETLYLGLRHALIHANEVTPDYLRHLSDDQFSAMLIAWFQAQPCSEIDDRNIPDVIGDMRAMAASPKSAKTIAVFCRIDLCNFMFLETLSTALLANPQVVNKAESGTPPPLPVVSIALLRREDVDNWVTQNDWFDLGRCSGQARVDRLELREPSARLRQLKTRVTFRQFVLPVDGADLGARVLATTRASAEQLLGRLDSPEPGGDLASGVKGLGARLRKSARTHATLQALHYRACRDEGRDHPSAVAVHGRIERVEQEVERLRSNIRTLSQAGTQLKALWVRCGGCAGCRERPCRSGSARPHRPHHGRDTHAELRTGTAIRQPAGRARAVARRRRRRRCRQSAGFRNGGNTGLGRRLHRLPEALTVVPAGSRGESRATPGCPKSRLCRTCRCVRT